MIICENIFLDGQLMRQPRWFWLVYFWHLCDSMTDVWHFRFNSLVLTLHAQALMFISHQHKSSQDQTCVYACSQSCVLISILQITKFQKLWAKWPGRDGNVSLRDFSVYDLLSCSSKVETHAVFLSCVSWKGTFAILMRTDFHSLTLWQLHCSFINRNRCFTYIPMKNRCGE